MSKLKQAFEAALASDPVRQMSARLREQTPVVSVTGPTGGARSLAIAQAILSENRPVAVFAATNVEAQNLVLELRYFLELLGPVAPPVIHFPSLEVDPYRGLSPHPEIAAERSQALWQLLQDGNKVVVASARAAVVRLKSPQHFLSFCLELKQEESSPPELLREHLRATGYVEDDPVTEPGEFSLRGGILDVFSPQMEHPLRLEFYGDVLESLRTFDVDTQRSIATLSAAEIIPMREVCPDSRALQRWAEEAGSHWSRPFHASLEEEFARARAGEPFPGFEFLLPAVDPLDHSLFDFLPGFRLVLCDHQALQTTVEKHYDELYERYVDRVEALKAVAEPQQIYLTADEFNSHTRRFPRLMIDELTAETDGASPIFLSCQPGRRYHGNIRELISDLEKFRQAGDRVVFLFSNLGRAERVADILKEYEIPSHLYRGAEIEPGDDLVAEESVLVGVGALHAGFFLPASGLRVLTEHDVFELAEMHSGPRRSKRAHRELFLSDFRDLKPGDYVVHIDHGIGQFHGLKTLQMQDMSQEFVLLTYHDEAKLYVPVERLDLIQKYSNMGGARPTLDRLGSASWTRTKARIKKSMVDMASQLLRLYAERQMVQGFAFAADTPWQQEFEDAFEFELTPDQSDAVEAVKQDMEAPRPMDRLLCGDVGYGKTEVAMRAAFKAVMDGKQAAVLAPTTVLAFQHFNTFKQRFTAFPVTIQLLSRFRSAKEQKQVLAGLEAGTVDIVIGTHRLLSKDVAFKDLGIVVVDEEQRFGVAHKERLKEMKTRVDVLTLSATPIPRTLHMSLLGLRDMSTIETPPKNRLAIQTSVLKYSPDVIRSSIELELARKGQVYFVHNRVETIHSIAEMVQRLVPQAKVGVAHGQMSERELESVMFRFVQDELDVLVATTIIENGLDIPRVNTIIVNRADLYGLSQLYQLRGRVGRSDRRAYAYLLIPSDDVLTTVARKRLAAIREFSELGTGFRVAALDLEIRGAGNLLGGEQHGHIDSVGFDLYCRLLEETVQELQGTKTEEAVSTSINLNLDIRIPEAYIGDSSQRLRMYKRISSAANIEELHSLKQEVIDRFGVYPEQVENLFQYAHLRQDAVALKIQAIEKNRGELFFRFVDQSQVHPQKLLKLIARNSAATFSPQGVLTLRLESSSPPALFRVIRETLNQIRA